MSDLAAYLEDCRTCLMLAERFPGRPVGKGEPRGESTRCATHGEPAPVPDPTRTLDGLRQQGHVRAICDAARAALALYVDPEVLRDALEGAIRGAQLERVG